MPKTVRAKLLLGWMPQQEALKTLDRCIFQKKLKYKDQLCLWERYAERVSKLPLDNTTSPEPLALTPAEQSAAEAFLDSMKKGPNGTFIKKVIKVNPGNLAIHQFMVITDRAAVYAANITDDLERIRHCLGTGMQFKGTLPVRQNGNRIIVRLPHAEFVPELTQAGLNLRERDRYVAVVKAGGRLLLWGGYHRTHAVFSQMTPEAAGGAPLVTLMEGTPDFADFLSTRSPRPSVRDAVLRERPPFFRDFFNADLVMNVDLLKQRVEVHIEPVGLGMIQARLVWVNET